MEDLKNRIQILEDVEAIKNLRRMYCYWADEAIKNGDPAKMDPLIDRFTDDFRCDFQSLGIYNGKAASAAFFKEVVIGSLGFSAHMVCNPIIEVNGNNAKGLWYVFVPCTVSATNTAAWLHARYNEEYVRENGRWMWKSIMLNFDFLAPFDEGWVKTKMMI